MTEDAQPDGTLSAPTRILAGLAGGVVLILSAFISAGSSLFAPLGVLAADAVAKRRGFRATRATTWVASIIASMAAIVLGAALIFAVLPAAVRQEVRAGFDSAQEVTRSQQREELARQGLDPAVADRLVNQMPAFSGWLFIVGAMMMIGVIGTMGGSAGWAATFLIAAAFTGRWPWRGEPPPYPGIMVGGPS